MKSLKNIYMCLALGVTAFCAGALTSCSDDMPAESYYTFTGEYLSDYLSNNKDYSKFTEIVKRAENSERGVSIMDLVSCYGQFTAFIPTNEAVDAYLKQNNYNSVSDIPYNLCDTLARTHILNGTAYNLMDFSGITTLGTRNMNDRKLEIKEIEVGEGENKHVTYCLNKFSNIIYSLANDSVQNGIVHPVDAVIQVSNKTLPELMMDNPNISLFYEALEATGLNDIMRKKIEDKTWNPDLWEDKKVYSGAQWDYCNVPKDKKYGFTVFACPNTILEGMGITNLQEFYNEAKKLYGGDDLDLTKASDLAKLKKLDNPLRRWVAYNCLDRKCSYDMLTTICTIATEKVNPTEWYSTLDTIPLNAGRDPQTVKAAPSTLKITRLTVADNMGAGDETNALYLNRGDFLRGDNTRGARIYGVLDGDYMSDAINGFYYTTDGMANYSTAEKDRVFNTRVRMDMYTFFPELASNDIRSDKTEGGDATDIPNPKAPCYWFPKGYLDNVKVNEDGIFLYQGCRNSYWSYEGDEFNLASDVGSYDVTFNLPSVPSGHYQIRLGFADMPTRGICQFYLDGKSQNTPFDMRDANFTARTSFFTLSSVSDEDELESRKKNMHNLGWYHGPKSVFSVSGTGHKDLNAPRGTYFSDNSHTVRYVLCEADLDEDVQHTIRIKSVWAVGSALVMMDYFELVPKSVYGVGEAGDAEDDY